MSNHMGLSDVETQSSLNQSPAPVLFGKCAPAVRNRTPDPLSNSSILFISVPDQNRLTKTTSHEPNRTRINLQHQVGKLIYFLM